jgi:hypothetical protein
VAEDKNESDDGSRCNALQGTTHADLTGHLFWASAQEAVRGKSSIENHQSREHAFPLQFLEAGKSAAHHPENIRVPCDAAGI